MELRIRALLELLGQGCKAVIEDGSFRYRITYNPTIRTQIGKENMEKLKNQHPDIYEEYTSTTESRIFRIKKEVNGLLQYPDQKQGDGKKVTTVNKISLEDMSFSYQESNKKVFDRINLNFKRGTLYGIHGKSGQGKSTLFKIIAGVYQPTEGNIIVNDTDLQELDINNYWENTGYVMQRTQFFNDTVRRNMGLLHIVSEEEMDTVAKCLDLYDEIHALEMVWDTEIKIDPCNFSEGQMRRLDIMRNILKNSQLLIFDEATANIDEKRRGNFYHLLHKLSKDKIIIFSTHNLEELREADIIVDLEKLHIRQVSEK